VDIARVHFRQEFRKPDFFLFLGVAAVFTTCQSRKAETTMTPQKRTVLIVEFTENSS